MANEGLKKLLSEWNHYEILKNTLPSRIARQERKSIANAVKFEVNEIKKRNEYDQVSKEDKELIEKIIDLLEKDNFG